MSKFQGWFLLVLGMGVVVIAVQGLFRGWLPNGRNGFKQGEGVSRENQPLAFWLFFALYFGGGLYVTLYEVGLLLGHAGLMTLR